MKPLLSGHRVMVTGGAGFLGTHVVRALEAQGCTEVFVPRSCDHDLRQREVAIQYVKSKKPSVVLHLAARVGGIGYNAAYPASLMADNLAMGLAVFEAVRLAQVPKLVTVGTVCAYPRETSLPFREDDLWLGYPEPTNAPYGLAKKILLELGQAYRQEHGLCAVHVMPTNLYGPGDTFCQERSHVIPAIIAKVDRAMRQGHELVELWGHGTESRDFLFVRDAATAMVDIVANYRDPEPMNLGTGAETTIAQLASLIGDLMGFKGGFSFDAQRPGGQPRRCLDTQRALKRLGWRAETSLERGLSETIQWFRHHGSL